MNPSTNTPRADAEILRETYAKTNLARYGMSFERAMQSDAVRKSLELTLRHIRKIEAKRAAMQSAVSHQVPEAA